MKPPNLIVSFNCCECVAAKGISAVENIIGRPHVVNHNNIPAACFTHPEIAMVGLTEEQAKAKAQADGFPLGKSVGHFRANSKALAENEGDGIAKVGELLLPLLLLSLLLLLFN